MTRIRLDATPVDSVCLMKGHCYDWVEMRWIMHPS